jgi:hypothetical protein
VGIAASAPTRGGARIAASCWRSAGTDIEARAQSSEARGEATADSRA